MKIDSLINNAVSLIVDDEKKRHSASKRILSLRDKFSKLKSPEMKEECLSYAVKKNGLDAKVGGVDSGFVSKRLANAELVFIRSVGVVFEYKKSRLCGSSYYPDFYHFPEPKINNLALDHDEAACSISLLRLVEEVKTAEEIIEKYKPEFCFLDGSIIPQYADKPRKDSKVHSFYREIIDEFQKLYSTAEKNNCTLVACVEDSRGSRIREILQHTLEKEGSAFLVENMLDSMLLDSILSKGERSFSFNYTSSIREHPILMDYDRKWAEGIYAFYIKTAELDRPLRVEFISSEKNLCGDASRIAEIVYSLSSMHREYAFPSVLIEADLRARLRPEEIETVYNKIIDKIGRTTKITMRRNHRPF